MGQGGGALKRRGWNPLTNYALELSNFNNMNLFFVVISLFDLSLFRFKKRIQQKWKMFLLKIVSGNYFKSATLIFFYCSYLEG